MPSSELLGHQVCMWCTFTHAGKTLVLIKSAFKKRIDKGYQDLGKSDKIPTERHLRRHHWEMKCVILDGNQGHCVQTKET